MPIPIGTTFWRCPVCKHHATIDGGELATVGTPFCSECDKEQEMEHLDAPIPTILHLDDGEDKTFIGVALRPRRTSISRFEARIALLWAGSFSTSRNHQCYPYSASGWSGNTASFSSRPSASTWMSLAETRNDMTKQEQIAARFHLPVETIRYIRGQGWYYDGRGKPILLGRSFHEIQCTPDWALRKIT